MMKLRCRVSHSARYDPRCRFPCCWPFSPSPPHPPSNIGAIVWQFLSEDFGFVNDTCVQVTLFRSLFLTREVGSKLFWNGLTVYRRPGGALYLIISEKAGKIHYSCSETATYTGSGKGIKFNEEKKNNKEDRRR